MLADHFLVAQNECNCGLAFADLRLFGVHYAYMQMSEPPPRSA